MNLPDMPELAFTRLTWREKLAVLHIDWWHILRRLLRLEHRYYLVLDGKVVGKFIADIDHQAVLDWLADSHRDAHDFGFAIGKEYPLAQQIAAGLDYIKDTYGDDPDAGAARTP